MKLKYKIIIAIILLLTLISTIKTTYSRYASEASSTATYDIAKWEFKLNNTDITESTSNSFILTPTIDTNTNVKSGKVAPGSTGKFQINIDATKVDVSYNMVVSITPTTIADMKIDYYKVCTSADVCGSNQNVNNTSLTINKNNLVNNSGDSVYFGSYYILVTFYWNDSTGETLNNTQDTTIGHNAAENTTTTGSFNVSTTFTQYTG